MDPRYLGVGMITETGGMSYVSDIYTPNDNVSYSVMFQDVNFTFLYWTYLSYLTDDYYTAYFRIHFSDNNTEVLNLRTGAYGDTYRNLPLLVVITVHSSPMAGILYSGYLNSPTGWQFVVSST